MTADITSRGVVAHLGQTPLAGPSGALWSHVSEQLNVNLVKLDAGDSMGEHVNNEVDVLLVVNSGRGSVTIGGVVHDVGADSVVVVPIGVSRMIVADERLVYFSIHTRRGGPAVGRSPNGDESTNR